MRTSSEKSEKNPPRDGGMNRLASHELQRKNVLGLHIVGTDGLTLMDKLIQHLMVRKGATVFFVNAHTLYLKNKNNQFAQELQHADYLLNDGIGIELAARAHGLSFKENLVGTDFIPRFLTRVSIECKARIFLIGGDNETALKAADYVTVRFPDLEVAGVQNGFFSEDQVPLLCNKIVTEEPDIILVGMGQPRQELLIAKFGTAAPQALIFGVGGLFDYWSESLTRAPALIRKLRLEWLHIILLQPYKIGRYAKCIPFVVGQIFVLIYSRWISIVSRNFRSASRYILRRICATLSMLIVLRNKLFNNSSVCVFTYHHITDERRLPFNVRLARFEKQMEFLSRSQIVMHPKEFLKVLDTGFTLKGPKVFLTFDDGYKDFYLNAYPILQRLRLPCILFVNTFNLDSSESAHFVTRSELMMMKPEIVTVCSHSHSHALLSACDDAQIETEIGKSKRIIEELNLGNTDYFAYPYGTINAFDERSMRWVSDHGFRVAFTSIHGLVNNKTNPYRVPRIRVDDSDSVLMFMWAIWGGLNLWSFIDRYLSRFQRVPK